MVSFRLILRSIALLSRRDRYILLLAATLQTAIAFLDLFAVLVLGIVASSAASQGSFGTTTTTTFSSLLRIGSMPLVWLATVGGAALVVKSLLSLGLTRRIYSFLANRQAMVSGHLAQRLLTGSILDIQRRSSQQTAFALTAGVSAATVNVLGSAMVIVAELALIVLLTFGLLLVDPLVAVFALAFFGALATVLQLGLGRWARRLGDRERLADIASMESLQHSMRAYREIKVTGRRAMFIERFTSARWQRAQVQADVFILSQFGKYVFEVGLVAGGGLLVLLLVHMRSLVSAIAVLTVFLIASSRLVPSLLRLQTAFSTIRNSAGLSEELFEFVDEIGEVGSDPATQRELELRAETFNRMMHAEYPGFRADVRIERVSLTYPGMNRPALIDVGLSIPAGSSIAFVGPTGSGKSTLADIVLGVLEPDSGAVRISDTSASEATSMWPGAMAYVPQDVAILTGTVRSNVALGIPDAAIDDSQVWAALTQAHLYDFIASTPDDVATLVGENGVTLSGGQRQRLGLARALYSRPRLIVLDEATSALDSETEHQISHALRALSGQVTLIIIAHRLATIRDADQVLYLDHGRAKAIGPFEHVRTAVPEFDRQANLLGL